MSAKLGRPRDPFVAMRNWIADARRGLRVANAASVRRRMLFNPETKFFGICAAAEALGVHRIHLYLVLSGKRESRSLLRRYQQLTKKP